MIENEPCTAATQEIPGQVLRDRLTHVRELSGEVRSLAKRVDTALFGGQDGVPEGGSAKDPVPNGLVGDGIDSLNDTRDDLTEALRALGKVLAQIE